MPAKFLYIFFVPLLALCFSSTSLAADHTVGQKDKSFVMNGKKIESLTIKKGDKINFRNEDPFFHNIFSLSALKTFDLGSYPAGQSKAVTFEKAGTAEIECAIHPQMFLEVTIK